jgi:hypothetical protein
VHFSPYPKPAVPLTLSKSSNPIFSTISRSTGFTTPTSTLISSPTAMFLFLKLLSHHLFLSDIFSPLQTTLPFLRITHNCWPLTCQLTHDYTNPIARRIKQQMLYPEFIPPITQNSQINKQSWKKMIHPLNLLQMYHILLGMASKNQVASKQEGLSWPPLIC